MSGWLRSLSYKTEFAIVILFGFGYFMVGSVVMFISLLGASAGKGAVITNAHLYYTVVYETIALTGIALFLRLRGWSMEDFNLKISIRQIGAGLLLAGAAYAIIIFGFIITFSIIQIDTSIIENSAPHAASLSTIAIALIVLINPLYEELLVVGYVCAVFRERKGVWFAINTSVAIRLLYHLYQGPIALLFIVPLGLLFATIYIRTNKLWPLVVAHGIIDIVGLTMNSGA